MIAEYLDFPRAYKKISTKLKTCKKRKQLKERLSKSINNLMQEEMEGKVHFIQSVREATGYRNLAKRASLFSDMRESVLNYAQKTQELTFTADIFGIEYKQDISETGGIRYDFFIVDKKARRRKELKEEKASELSLKVLNLLKMEEFGKVELSYAKRLARQYKNESRKIKCVGEIKEVILKHEEKIQEPTITGDIFEVYYTKNANDADRKKIYEFFIPRAALPRKQKMEYLLA